MALGQTLECEVDGSLGVDLGDGFEEGRLELASRAALAEHTFELSDRGTGQRVKGGLLHSATWAG